MTVTGVLPADAGTVGGTLVRRLTTEHEIVAAKTDILGAAMREMGCTLNNAYMQHSLLALVVIPELRISDVGLVDVRTFEQVDVFV